MGTDGRDAGRGRGLFHICVRTVRVHPVCSVRTLLLYGFDNHWVLKQCSYSSDRVCANSRTLDIGKARGLSLRLSLAFEGGVLGGRFFWVFVKVVISVSNINTISNWFIR